MAEELVVAEGSKEEKYKVLLPQLEALMSYESDPVAVMANLSAAIMDTFKFLWVGFYRVAGDRLVLGPFQGPLACTRIAHGKGVCGTAWAEARTLVVADVDAFPGHIACSSSSRSEIVVPFYRNGAVAGVLDIDSADLDTFDSVDAEWLEKAMAILSEKLSGTRERGEKRDGVVVYCASSSEVPQKYLDAAYEMGELIAKNGFTLVTGGGYRGLMASTIDGALAGKGKVTGVLPHFMLERGWAHEGLTRCIDTPSMHVRKQTMADLSVAAVALPGGIGTLDELCEIMAWSQLKLFPGKVVLVNVDGFFDPLISMFDKMREEGFMRGGEIPVKVVSTPQEAIEYIGNSSRRG